MNHAVQLKMFHHDFYYVNIIYSTNKSLRTVSNDFSNVVFFYFY